MPPRTTSKSDSPGELRKEVSFVAKDDDQQVAVGIVMVPDKVDLQGDFAREDQIREFADQFADLEAVGQADGGVMHAVWPDDHITLERNEVLDESEDIGGSTAPSGAWIQAWKFEDDELWGLVTDGILAGYSIGAVNVHWDGPYEDEDLPDDVAVPEDVDAEEAWFWQITDGIVREVSAVDIPAVPDAEILETKADADKRLADHLGSRDGFIEEAQQRGHSEAEAERLWEYLNDAVDIEGAGDPSDKSWLARAKDFFTPDTPGRASDPAFTEGDTGASTKEGRTLSQANRESAMAAVDASLDVLHDAGYAEGMTRFTDQDSVDFDLSEHDARDWSDNHDDDEDGGGDEESGREYAAGGDTPDDSPEHMGDTPSDDGGDDKSLAERNAEQIDELTDAVTELTAALTGDDAGDSTVELELESGEVVEVAESDLEAALGNDTADDTGDIASLQEQVKALTERVDTIAEQGGGSGQIRAAARGDDGDDESEKLDEVSAALS
jgi:hypothetical protein